MLHGWIGVDLDGTLATYEPHTAPKLGEPIPEMIARVKYWLGKGIEVRIVTARASHPAYDIIQRGEIERWLMKYIGYVLKIQCSKDFNMIELWDDRVVQVETNTGKVIGISRMGWK